MARITGNWRLVASELRLQRSSQALSVLNNRAYIFGGEVRPREPVDDQVDTVNLHTGGGKGPCSDTVTAVSCSTVKPAPRVGSPSAVLGDAIYLFSGRGGLAMAPIEEEGALWRFDPEKGAWDLIKPSTVAAAFPEGRSYHAIASDNSQVIYIHSGCPEKGRLADLWSFDTISRAWSRLPAAPSPARGGASLAFSCGKLYRMNGFDGTREQGGTLDIFDPTSQTWETVVFNSDGVEGPEPRSVSALLAVAIRGKEYLMTLFGEHDPSSLGHAGAGKMLSNAWAFDLDEQVWNKVQWTGDSPAPRGWFDADVLPGKDSSDSIIVHGGLAEDNSRLGDVWQLQFEEGSVPR